MMSHQRFEYEVQREEYEQGEVDTARELANDPEYQEWLTRTLKEDLEYRMGKGE